MLFPGDCGKSKFCLLIKINYIILNILEKQLKNKLL